MSLSIILFLIGALGFVLNRKNIIGQVYAAVYIISIAGAESAIGLGILVAYYRLRGNISINLN